jgi:F-type H+-transporting ATPase subunit a
MIDIAFVPQYIAHTGRFMLTNTFVASIGCSLLLIGFAVFLSLRMRSRPQSGSVRVTAALVKEALAFTDSITEDRALSKHIFPLVATFFVYITTSNLLALLPGFGSVTLTAHGATIPLLRSANSDLTATLALALFSVFATEWISLRVLGIGNFVRRFIDLSGPIRFFSGIFEFVSEMIRIVSFSFRLFGNILAGEVLLIVISFLFPFLLPVPFMLLEVFVGVLQGFIFASLTATFMKTGSTRLLVPTPHAYQPLTPPQTS